MKMVFAAIAIVFCLHASARSIVHEADIKQYPVTKVITLLKDMQAQLEKEGEEDEEVYDKVACWCKTNDKDKSQSIKDAETRIADLTTVIEETAAESGRLKAEISNQEADLAKAQKSLDDLTAIRAKQSKEFNAEEKDMLQSIKALESAVVVLSKHHSGAKASLMDAPALKIISQVMRKHEALLQGAITPRQKKIGLGAFMQGGRQPSTKFRSYDPASGEVFGIIRQMKETFEGNLADSQKEEAANAKAFEEQKAAKMDEIKAMTQTVNQKRTQLAKADETNAQSKEDLEDTQDSLTIDDKFLIDLKERCKKNDQEWEVRQKARQEEIAAIVKAIMILNDDAAQDTFSKTFNPAAAASLLQKRVFRSSRKHSGARSEAARVLRLAAARAGNPNLAGLALSAELDAFTKVKAAIDAMITQLGSEKKAEIAEKGYCVDKLNENELFTEKKTHEKSDTESKIATLETTIADLKTVLESLHKEIAKMNLEIKRAGEDRELMNKDFQTTISDQRETQKLLSKALTVLKAVYAKQKAVTKAVSLGQVHAELGQEAPPPPPPGFKAYSKNAGGGGAVALLTEILGEAKVMEAEAIKDEQAAQAAYEKFVKDTNDAIKAKQKAIVNKSQDKANAEKDLGDAKTDLDQHTAQLQQLENQKNALRLQCDYLLKNFDLRQQARDEEIDALRQAKAILSGMQVD